MKSTIIKKEIELRSEDDLSMIELFYDEQEIGWASFETDFGYIYPEAVEIDRSHRGLGLYKDIINFVIENMEEMAGVEQFRSIQRTEPANKFWQKYASIEDYDEGEHNRGEQEQIIIDSNWNIDYR